MSLPRYPKYKESGVEWLNNIPEHWRVDRLKRSIDSCKNGIWGDEAQEDENDIPCVRVADFDRQRLTVALADPTIRNVKEKERVGRVLVKGDLLIEKSGGGEKQPVGCVVLFTENQPAVCSNFVARMQVRAGMDSSFWRYVHAAAYAIRLNIGSINQTSGIQNLDAGRYFDERAAFPPPGEQFIIGVFLDSETSKIDALVEEQRRLIELLKEKRQAVISHAVTKGLNPDVPMKNSGTEWLGMVPKRWGVRRLRFLCSIQTGEKDTVNAVENGAYPADVLAWVQQTRADDWKAIVKNHGAKADETLLKRVREEVNARGTLDVLRHGIDMHGLRGKLPMAQFKPALAMNPQLQARYQANRLRVVRQVRYSVHNELCLDLVLFLNGLPVATVELKTDFTQSVDDAIDQYRFDRLPRTKGNPAEPLLSFPAGALVHFAVSNSEVHMTTKLAGPQTRFLPFNKGNHGAKGNPPNPKGHQTAYLWEEVWERESWLEIIGRYLVTVKDSKKQIESVIFPRYHQLDATRKLLAAVRETGAGGKYLIQHSAGSGKTNSIAWSAHFLADLHDSNRKKVFDSVLVVSDRNVIDKQLQDAIFDFERTAGVVATITGDGGSKSQELMEALGGGKKIVVCTIQTFPAAIRTVHKLTTQGKRFAVIADEAHSSQTGEAAAKLKAVLTAEEQRELEDGGEVSTQDLMLLDNMTARADQTGITYVAFTATPKAKTLELFGTRPDPEKPAGPDNLPQAFHVYSMRQAIEEGFILDVLQNYTSYRLAFKLANNGKEYDDHEVEQSAAMKGIMRWVRLHPYNISQKVQIVVEHFRENVQPLLMGHAKAMVVVGSRLEAVRWQIAIDKYIKSQGYKLATVVAFSGEVVDSESGTEHYTETSKTLNPNLRGRDIRKAFDTDEYQILLAANKFQTGFDQPLLCGMYVDKRLAGIQAVQTLSRLNRSYPGPYGVKNTTFVLDFVKTNPEDVLTAFKMYYETAELENVTDPNLIYNLRSKLDAAGHYDEFEVDRVVAVVLNPKAKQSELLAALEPVVSRLLARYKEAQTRLRAAKASKDDKATQDSKDEIESLVLFRRDIGTFQHAYTFLSQIFDYGNAAIEGRYLFYKALLPLLEFGRERDEIDLSKVVLTHHTLKDKGKQAMTLEDGDHPKLPPLTDSGSGSVQEKEKALLAEIIAKVNDLFEGDLTEGDKLVYVNNVIKGKLMESEVLRQQANSNTKEQFSNSPDLGRSFMNAIMDAAAAHGVMSKQALASEKVRKGLLDVLLGPAQLYEALRAKGDAAGDVESK